SDRVRASIYIGIACAECPQMCANYLQVDDRRIPKSTLSLQFRILREAGLIRSERRGVEMLNTSRCREIDQKFPGLLSTIVRCIQAQQADRS
ncbi:MAG: helix-turn-helix transcriptional regulator, partial [Nitrospira sp.]|nr:helix-turn-helix transcriptional regulator [Nitrospira sp.]